jgi:hypothetical protein
MARYRKTNRRQRVRVTSRDIAGHCMTRPRGRCTIIWPVPPTGDVTDTIAARCAMQPAIIAPRLLTRGHAMTPNKPDSGEARPSASSAFGYRGRP